MNNIQFLNLYTNYKKVLSSSHDFLEAGGKRASRRSNILVITTPV